MKRTPSWVVVAAAGVQLAALGLCVWAMERWLRAADEEPPALAPAPDPPRAAAESPRPMLGPPPERARAPEPELGMVPSFIVEAADATSQIVAARTADGRLAFGFYPDGNIRFVDVDGGRYAGKAESARARMREIGGMRAFTVLIGVAEDGRLQAIFTGGNHDAETFSLEPLVGWSVA